MTMKRSAAARQGRSRAADPRAPALHDRLVTVLERARDVPVDLLRRPPPPPVRRTAYGAQGRLFALRLPSVGPAVSFVRNDLRRWLSAERLRDPEVFEICLACSEVVANAVQHPVDPSRPVVEIAAVSQHSLLVVVVRDYGAWRSGPTPTDRGRGLALARSLMDELEVERGSGGTSVVMVRRVATDAS
jgi:anti-sigma regulatory factor (Ser/Thr protein kinase)